MTVIDKPNAGINVRPQHLPGQTPVTQTKTDAPQTTQTPSDTVGHDGGKAEIGGQDQTLGKGEAVSAQLLAKLDKLAKSGKVGTQVADPGDVDIEVSQGAWRLPDAKTARSLGQIGTVLQGDDVDLQNEVLLVLAAAEETTWTAQREADEQLPDGARTSRSQAMSRVLSEAQKQLPKRTLQIWQKTGEAFKQLKPTLERVTGRRDPAGTENPFFDGTATYGQPIDTQWFTPQPYELCGFDSAVADAIIQGQLRDCYLIATLAALAVKDPNILHDMVKYDPQKKTFTVEFYELEPFEFDPVNHPGQMEVRVKQPKKKVSIEVDPSILLDDEGYAIGAGVTDMDGDGFFEVGINVIEKAFALYNDQLRAEYPNFVMFGEEGYTGYNGIEGGYCDWVLQALAGEETGWDSIPASNYELVDVFSAANTGETVMAGSLGFPYNGSATEAEQLVEALAQMGGTYPAGIPTSGPLTTAQRQAVDAAIADVWPYGLVPGHAYTALGTCVIDGEVYAVFRNPWGEVEPEGPTSGDNDGVFMMPIDEVEKFFGGVFFDADAPATGANAGPNSYTDFTSALSAYLTAVQRHGADVGVNLGTGNTNANPDVPDLDLVTIAQNVGAGLDSSMQSRWEGFVSDLRLGGGTDIHSLVQWVLREAYMENLMDLRFYAEKVRFYNNIKKEIRNELQQARNLLGQFAGLDDADRIPSPYQPKEFDSTYYGNPDDIDPTELGEEERAAYEAWMAEQEAIAAAEAERQQKIDEWMELPPDQYDAQSFHYYRNYSDSSDYNSFNRQWEAMIDKVLLGLRDLTPEQEQAIMEQIMDNGGLKIRFRVDDTDKKDNTYDKTYTVIPREGESLDDFLRRAIAYAGEEFKGWVKGEEGNINIHGFDTYLTLPEYEYKNPLPPDLRDEQYTKPQTTAWQEGELITTKGHLESYIENLDQQLNAVGDDAQLANVDMQNMLQKQQQTLQMMSNISKTLHDTAMSIIRKIGS